MKLYSIPLSPFASRVADAGALLAALPLGRAGLMEFDLVPLGPLAPLGLLLPES